MSVQCGQQMLKGGSLQCGFWPRKSQILHDCAVKQRGRENKGPAGYCPKIVLVERAKMVPCPFHRSQKGKSALEIGDEISG